MCTAPLFVFSAGLIGLELSGDKRLATLPVAAIVLGTALTVYPVSALSRQYGRHLVFTVAMMLGCLLSLIAVLALKQASFVLFVIVSVGIGAVVAAVQQFRFAAMESTVPEKRPVAASRLLVAGILAAYLGPELVIWGQLLDEGRFTGAFWLLAGLFLLAFFIVLIGFRNVQQKDVVISSEPVSWGDLFRHPGTALAIASAAIGFAVMSFIMTATPLSMETMHHYSLQETKQVIQHHILAMFVPSLFAGWLIRQLGFAKMISAGIVLYIVSAAIALVDQTLVHYWWSLLLLGIGWNLLFVSGTSLLPQTHDPEHAYQIQGMNDLVVFSAQGIGALASGSVLLLLGWQGLIYLTLPFIALLLWTLLRWITFRREMSSEH